MKYSPDNSMNTFDPKSKGKKISLSSIIIISITPYSQDKNQGSRIRILLSMNQFSFKKGLNLFPDISIKHLRIITISASEVSDPLPHSKRIKRNISALIHLRQKVSKPRKLQSIRTSLSNNDQQP
jgi:hypothetical protein